MTEHDRCPDCGAELPTGATAGLCPRCLLAGAMDSSEAPGGGNGPLAPTTPLPGGFVPPSVESLAAHFPQLEIVALLGHGGMGAVYKARQTKLDRFVALKIIRPESADDPAFAERFTREARTLARLGHPNIVAVHDFGELPGGLPAGSAAGRTLFYFLMEYVDGANLRELMQSGGLQPEQALAIVPQICDALQYAHDEGVVHRDIKPENILIDRRGRVKIADFGLAKLAAQAPENFTLTATHQVMGTPRYMAPEQMTGSHAVDPRADIYSLGVVFYEMLTGELPLGSFEPPSRKSAVDPRLDAVVLRSLAREPERRYQRASEVRTDVDSILRGESAISAGPSSDSRPEPERGESAGEAIWEIAGILAGGWLFYMVLMLCAGVIVWAARSNWFGLRSGPGSTATGATGGISWGWLATGLVVAAIGLAGLVSAFRRWRKSSAGRHDPAARPSTSSAAAADLQAAGAPSYEWSASEAASRPGASTVLERQVAAIVDRFRGEGDETAMARPTRAGVDVPRFSRKAILAACWAPLVIGVPLAFVPMQGPIIGWPVWWQWPLIFTIGPLGAMAPFGTTILGLVAISEIRHSRGRLIGLPLAFVDAVLFPTLLLNVGALTAVDFLFEQGAPRELRVVAAAVAGLACVLVDMLVLRRCWRAALQPPGHDAGEGAGAEADLSTQPPLAYVDFTVDEAAGFGDAVTFHFSGLGYRLMAEQPNEWAFERGRKSAALGATDLRDYPTTLVVRTVSLADGRLRVRCAWQVRTYGAFYTASEIKKFEAEGQALHALLEPNGTRREPDSDLRLDGAAAPLDETEPAPAAAFPDLDLRRIQMELKGPAGGLLVVALLSTLFWCVNGAMLVWDQWSVGGRYRLPPPEIAGIVAVAAILLLAVGILVHGARHMRRMTGYGWSYAASILAMLPWSPAALVGLPVGIWAFRLLGRPDMRDAFLARAMELEEAARRSGRRGGRDWVTLTREQVEDDDLPDVCMVCGAPTRERVNKEFSWAPDWAGFLCLLGLWPGLIAIALTGKSMRLACPLCPADRGHWRRLVWVSSVGWVFAVPLAGLGYLIAELAGGRADAHLVGALVGAGLGLVLWLIPVIYLSCTRVSVKAITADRITLQRVSPAFARAARRRVEPGERREFVAAGESRA